MVKQVKIDEFIELARHCVVLDVRSEGEYEYAHIPGAYSLPLFSNEERKVVGTAYKQESREQAIKIGLDYFGVKMRKMVEQVEEIVAKSKVEIPNSKIQAQGFGSYQNGIPFPITNSKSPIPILVHCWRGGMRSAGVAWLLDLYGFEVCTLAGGYKSFRNWVLGRFEQPYSFKVLGGYTGSGKTEVLRQLREEKQAVVDLEGIAQHKGSAFGALGQPEQPTQEMFENKLALQLHVVAQGAAKEPVWIEDESSRIGSVNLPIEFWKTMRQSPVFFLDIPFEERLHFIVKGYGSFEKKELIASVIRIRKRLGSANAKDAVNHILDGNIKEAFAILLRYYDKYYAGGMQERENRLTIIPCDNVNEQANIKKLLSEQTIAG